ncbi:hypothetical protein XENOCAPTIV_029322, partial [Xenoophorus captivus]
GETGKQGPMGPAGPQGVQKCSSFMDLFFNASVENKVKEELQELKGDLVSQDMKVWQVPWELEGWREIQAFLDHQVPEVYL